MTLTKVASETADDGEVKWKWRLARVAMTLAEFAYFQENSFKLLEYPGIISKHP